MNNLNGGTNTLTRTSQRMARSGAALNKDQDGDTVAGPVLVAADLSQDSRAALLWACDYAANADVPVTVLHVLHDPAEAPGKYSCNASDPLMPMVDTADRMLSEFVAEMRADNPELETLTEARTKAVTGLPARTIVDQAVGLNATLIVMGSRGQTGLPNLLYGSTAKRVVQLSPIPVTVVKAQR